MIGNLICTILGGCVGFIAASLMFAADDEWEDD